MPTNLDNNYQSVGKAVTDDGNATVSNLLVDPATGRLLIDIAYEDYTTSDPPTKTDDIYEGTAMAVTDDANASTANPGLTDCSATALPDLVSIKNGTKTIQSEYDRLLACKT